jgi:dTDP-4-dehydrorhamnose reductase
MNSLVIGASGQVGALLLRFAGHTESCLGTYCSHPADGLLQLDLRDRHAAGCLIKEWRPKVCYLPAALTHVDFAESHRDDCTAINVAGVEAVARAMAQIGGRLVFFSTEHVFAERDRAWHENELPRPASVYAASKAAAEQIVRRLLPGRHLIVRTSWVYGPDPQEKNFFYRVRRTLGRGEILRASPEQWGQPTYGPDLARTVRLLVRLRAIGTIHIVGPQALTKIEWARMCAHEAGFSDDLIVEDRAGSQGGTAPRPRYICLSRRRLIKYLGEDPVRWPTAALRAMLQTAALNWRARPGLAG